MGFFNFEKDGPGVSKDGPRKKGIFLFFELLGRKIGSFCGVNLLYFIISIPMVAVSFLASQFFINYIKNIFDAEIGGVFFLQACQYAAFVSLVFIGSGPASAALAYFNRAAVREEPIFLVADFFEQFKKNFKQGIVVGILQPLFTYAMIFGIFFYGVQYLTTGAVMWAVMMFLLILVWAVFACSGFYIYQLMITFENSVIELYKNAVILALMNMPWNIVLSAVVLFINFLVFFTFTPVVSLILAAVCWTAVMRFALEFYAARYIQKNLIDKTKKSEEG